MSTDYYSPCTGMELAFHGHIYNMIYRLLHFQMQGWKLASSPNLIQREPKDLLLGPWIGPMKYQHDESLMCA